MEWPESLGQVGEMKWFEVSITNGLYINGIQTDRWIDDVNTYEMGIGLVGQLNKV